MRQNYFRMVCKINDDRILFINETEINLHINPHCGYSPACLTATISEPTNKEVNISFLLCISLTGVMNYEKEGGVINGELFLDSMTQLSQMNSNVSIVNMIDNTRIHKSRIVKAYLHESNMRVEFLPYIHHNETL
ncbi:hypothetical protein RF11_02858 [Thelohanellus kitauei]|uniref:Tc1-like transposase DDE domain-containing protein n=1 Tax=Thelohanellus kitauei TaxID=669202 RepID=A0A0C2MYT9_THEKT|nr:hypothetical protein RF11_02858 [Thelohanellus kitauei]